MPRRSRFVYTAEMIGRSSARPVSFSINEASPHLLVLPHENQGAALPFGPFDPQRHRTFEIGLREWVSEQANFQLGFVEQLYTFGDRGREACG